MQTRWLIFAPTLLATGLSVAGCTRKVPTQQATAAATGGPRVAQPTSDAANAHHRAADPSQSVDPTLVPPRRMGPAAIGAEGAGVRIGPVTEVLPNLRLPEGPLWPRTGPDLGQCSPPLAPGASGVTYVCDCQSGADTDCVAGDDGNNGSASAPLRTMAAARTAFLGLSAGGAVALCKGGAWRTTGLRISSAACTRERPCAIADYEASWSSGDEGAPLLKSVASGAVPMFNLDPGGPSPIGGMVFRNLRLEGNRHEGSGIMLFRNVSDVTMSCLDVSQFSAGVMVLSGGARVVLTDSRIHDNGGLGFLGGCTQCGVRRTYFSNNGSVLAATGSGAFAHNLYFSKGGQTPPNADGMFLTGSYFSRSAVDPATGRCKGTSVNVHGGVLSNLEISGNIVEEPPGGADLGCWGIAVDSASTGYEENSNIRIARNAVRNVGNISIGVSSCIDCVVENNVVIQEHLGGATGIAMPNRARRAEDAASTRFTARNNTVFYGGHGSGVGVAVGGEGTGHVVTNNVVAFATSSPSHCYGFDLAQSAYQNVRGNLCSGAPFARGAAGLDSMALLADPQFEDAPTDLRLAPGSPAIDSGWAGAAPTDDCVGRSRGEQPDRGAYER